MARRGWQTAARPRGGNIVLAMNDDSAITSLMCTSRPSKETIRAVMRQKRRLLPPEEGFRLSALACAHILASEIWRRSSRIGLYMAVRGEIDTAPLLEEAWKSKKQVFLPLCTAGAEGCMQLVSCSGPENLVPGAYGIPEPVATAETNIAEAHMPPELLIIPGLAFDPSGNRLGMGGGYYDRLLATHRFTGCLRLGLCYGFQIVDELPREDWDLPMHALCTENELLWLTE